ncbi:MAG: hypothetical protein E7339_08065 [Clostridiales bacterium]|nr:hypothetical protein [Clostridiales bacterium]
MRIFKRLTPIVSFLAVLLIYGIIFSLNNIYPFGELTISWCDMNQQTIPLLCGFKDVLSGKSDFWLSLENAGGMNFFGVYFFNLSSPFTYLVLFFEKSAMPLAVNIMVVLKLATSALTFALWLKYYVKNANPVLVIALSVAYAFSGWAMMYYQILSWLDTYYLFPLLLLGLHKLTENKSPALYVITLFACMLVHFYLGWAIVIFVCLYAGLFVALSKEKSHTFAKNFIISSIISALLSFLVLIPAFLQYSTSMRSGSLILNIVSTKFAPPIYTSYPTFFCIIAFIPFLFRLKGKNRLEHLEILFILAFLPVLIEPIASAWQTYDYMSFPTRYGFVTIGLALTLALKGITSLCEETVVEERVEKKDKYKLIIKIAFSCFAVAVCIGFAFYSTNYYELNKSVITKYSQTLWGTEASFEKLLGYYIIPFAFGLLIYFGYKYRVLHKIGVYALIAILCVVEAGFGARVYMVAPANDYKGFNRAFELEEVIDDDDFYRLKISGRSYFDVNLVGALGYNSLSHYTSLNRESYMLLVKELGYSSYWMETHSNGGTVFTDALVRHKYSVARGASSSAKYTTDSYYVTQNDLLFPTAFLISNGGESNSSNPRLERWQIQDELFKRLTGKSGIYNEIDYELLTNATDNSDNGITKITVNANKQAVIKYVFDIQEERAVYFDCFNLYTNSLREATYESVSSIKARVSQNGVLKSIKSVGSYPLQKENGVLYLGTYSNSQLIVEVTLNKDINARSFGLFTVDTKSLESAVNELIAGDFKVEKDFLSGKITALSETDALFTSFAYDEGYRAKVNGKKANTFSVNGFLAVELENGENIVEVDFLPRGLYLGVGCFTLGLVILAVYILLYKKVQEFAKLKRFTVYLVLALGVLILLAIYVMPIVVKLFYMI